ncbi:hypothetical protein [Achromobacter marplatensis]|uniref:hypothetical protein n=1 Tax=Achromobacter marplatensis TaxID=470868 RepID=UPI0028E830CB|nr:hypothetical protein [Achromobacter marplatensis]
MVRAEFEAGLPDEDRIVFSKALDEQMHSVQGSDPIGKIMSTMTVERQLLFCRAFVQAISSGARDLAKADPPVAEFLDKRLSARTQRP